MMDVASLSLSRLHIVTIVSVCATMLGCFLIVWVARSQGSDVFSLTGDSRAYVILAENVRSHGSFSLSKEAPFVPESFRSPGYPIFLAFLFMLFGVSLVALSVHALLMSLAPILFYIYARRWHEQAAFWAAIVFALEPVRIFLASSFLTDSLFCVLFLASLIMLERGRVSLPAATIAGVLLGFAILVRPIAQFLPFVYVAYIIFFWQSQRMRRVACVIVGVIVVVSPWMYRNQVLFGSWNISSVGAANLALYNSPAFSEWRPEPRAQEVLAAFEESQRALPQDTALSLERSDVFVHTFREVIAGREFQYATFHVLKTVPFFITDGLRDIVRLFGVDIGSIPNLSTLILSGDIASVVAYMRTGSLAIMLLVLGSGFWAIVLALFIYGTIRAGIRREGVILLLTCLVGYFALLTGPVSNARYRLPVEGFLIFGAFLVAQPLYFILVRLYRKVVQSSDNLREA